MSWIWKNLFSVLKIVGMGRPWFFSWLTYLNELSPRVLLICVSISVNGRILWKMTSFPENTPYQSQEFLFTNPLSFPYHQLLLPSSQFVLTNPWPWYIAPAPIKQHQNVELYKIRSDKSHMSTVLLPSFIAFTIPFESSNSGTPLPTPHLTNCQKPVLQTSMDGLFILHVPFPAMKIQSFPSWQSYHLRYIYIYYNIYNI